MPDGRTVMFTVRGAKGFDIASVASGGSGMRRLTDDGRSYDASPTADGTGIAYVRGFQDDADIWTMRADGTAAAKAFDTGGADYSPQWFSDGRLAFTGGIGSGSDVWVGAPGSAPTDITPDSAFQDFVVGSTAEGLILFASDRAQADGTFLYSMQPDGSEVHLVAIL
jgi:Tol biopolymer transport system component